MEGWDNGTGRNEASLHDALPIPPLRGGEGSNAGRAGWVHLAEAKVLMKWGGKDWNNGRMEGWDNGNGRNEADTSPLNPSPPLRGGEGSNAGRAGWVHLAEAKVLM